MCTLHLYIYCGDSLSLEEGVPPPHSHKGTTGVNNGPAVSEPGLAFFGVLPQDQRGGNPPVSTV